MDPTLYLIQVNWYHYLCHDGRLTRQWREAVQLSREDAESEVKRQTSAGARAMLEVVSVAEAAAKNAGTDQSAGTDLVEKACQLAERAHAGQTRRGGAPYIEHCRAVASRVADPVDKAVALLHDTLEPDCAHPLTYEQIEAECGAEVADGVITLTRLAAETYEAFIERIVTWRRGRWRGCKAADCLSNLADQPTARQIRRYSAALLVLVPEQSQSSS